MSFTLAVTTRCKFCRRDTVVLVDEAGYNAWRGGELIQHALPELSITQREQLISGTCQPCWDAIFAEPEA